MSQGPLDGIVAALMERRRLAINRAIAAAVEGDTFELASIIRSDERFTLLDPDDRKYLADYIEGKIKPRRSKGRRALTPENPVTRADYEKRKLNDTLTLVRRIKQDRPKMTHDQIADLVLKHLGPGPNKVQVLSELRGRGRRTK
jgi:hypothetical protein